MYNNSEVHKLFEEIVTELNRKEYINATLLVRQDTIDCNDYPTMQYAIRVVDNQILSIWELTTDHLLEHCQAVDFEAYDVARYLVMMYAGDYDD